ncbi:MAG: hypothetical protein COC09_03280 [Gammaproteobacteria bacterium]|nr:DUF3135 domain-containing protein [Gammaproteobacteria bacterium]PCH63086.1 MAG: hypothetical protein COC09_06645 [Gammaproteobacteria bacterium]PCH64272.1 MAG: hypothetical protein COC09_03280 [Gammaproteobacteria bacterium]
MSSNPQDRFDFDTWMQLFEENPDAFEAKRQGEIDQFMSELGDKSRDRMGKLQWRIDKERERSSSPMESCLRVHNMMWDSVYGERGLLYGLELLIKTCETREIKHNMAEILEFKRPN